MKNLITSPVGEAIFPHLNKPNTHFDDTGVFSLKLRLADVEAVKLQNSIMASVKSDVEALVASKRIDLGKFPVMLAWGQATDKDKNPLPGFQDFTIKQNHICGSGDKQWKFTPRLFDASGKPWDVEKTIWTGSKLKVAFRPSVWHVAPRVGITLRLVGVQVIELVTGGNDAASLGFDVVEDSQDVFTNLSVEGSEILENLRTLQKTA